ncbi:putative serine protease K12H4.7 [Leptinotarsa decemlineata]|uniref:putative serine protease K12H4.7 n=1 Tax=Leptinotarsa decemlineata TaxID=7539 RepID=UPI003D309D6A
MLRFVLYKIMMRTLIFLSIYLLSHEASGWGISNRNKFNSLRLPKEHLKDVQEHSFTQILDHFNPTDERTFQQRYFVNKNFVNGTSINTVFLFIGGEGGENGYYTSVGFMAEYAAEIKALCFSVEHRYYGESRPTENTTTKDLQFLTSQQALADLAFFVEAMNVKYNFSQDVKWIAIGGSYAGNLAAWLRLKYPHLITGAMSASGPLLAKLDFPEYLEVVADDLKRENASCLESVQRAFEQLKVVLFNSTSHEDFDELFQSCVPVKDSVENALDMENLFSLISDSLAYVAQYDNNQAMLNAQYGMTIRSVCEIMKDEKIGSEMARLAAVNKQISGQSCFDFRYNTLIEMIQGYGTSNGEKQWIYQTCTEFGYYQTSSNKTFGDGFHLDFFIQQCIDIFGPQYNKDFVQKAVERTNNFYGGLDIDVTNVVFVHGVSDPWHVLGITRTRNIDSPAILIEGVAHCAVMDLSSKHDPPQLKEARGQIKQIIGSWLKL